MTAARQAQLTLQPLPRPCTPEEAGLYLVRHLFFGFGIADPINRPTAFFKIAYRSGGGPTVFHQVLTGPFDFLTQHPYCNEAGQLQPPADMLVALRATNHGGERRIYVTENIEDLKELSDEEAVQWFNLHV